MNKREKGKKLEYIVADYLKEIDKYARPTKASGGSTEISDVLNRYFFVECKNRNRENLIIDRAVWNHLIEQLPVDTSKIPILVQRNNEGKIFLGLSIL